VVSQIVTPFGIGDELLGFIVAQRCQPGHHWTAAEIDAVESIAADLGRGLNHARLYEAENRLVEHLRSLDQAKSDFFATVSHELRTPLTSIEGYTEMLADEDDGPLTSRQQQMLATIDRNTTRLRNLVDDVFTLAKLESGAFTTVTHSINIAEIVAGAIQAIRPQAAAAKVTLTSRGPDDHLNVEGNADQLDRVMINLLSNSVKYTPANGRVDVSVAAQNGSVAVQVADTGIGIPEADQKNLFTRFFRASNAKAQAIPGTGLGLAIVRTIVASHGGDISVTSAETEGTTITVLLPLRTS
jgi:signal transduction histidine kinase